MTSEESLQNNNLTIDTSLSNNDSKSEPLSLSNSFHTTTPTEKRRLRRASTSDSLNTRNHRRFSSGSSSTSSEVVHQYKLTREDSQRPIASEKVKKRPEQHHHHHDKNVKSTNTKSYSSTIYLIFIINIHSLKQDQRVLCLYFVIIKVSLDNQEDDLTILTLTTVITIIYIITAICNYKVVLFVLLLLIAFYTLIANSMHPIYILSIARHYPMATFYYLRNSNSNNNLTKLFQTLPQVVVMKEEHLHLLF